MWDDRKEHTDEFKQLSNYFYMRKIKLKVNLVYFFNTQPSPEECLSSPRSFSVLL
jgi:hypothetical protein